MAPGTKGLPGHSEGWGWEGLHELNLIQEDFKAEMWKDPTCSFKRLPAYGKVRR